MDQLIFASLYHTHYWYEVGMLKVPAVEVNQRLLFEKVSAATLGASFTTPSFSLRVVYTDRSVIFGA